MASTLESLIGSVALQRRVDSGALKADDVPPRLRDLQAGIIKRSPFAIPIDQQYDLAPLLRFSWTQLAGT